MTITCAHGEKRSAACISVPGLCYNALNIRNVQTFLESTVLPGVNIFTLFSSEFPLAWPVKVLSFLRDKKA